mgnify:CR=1 FL=1
MPALTAGLGRPPNLPEVERAMPAKAHNNHRDMPRKSNGTMRAGRCTDASPARQARINSPEQSLKHRCQAVPGRLNRPAVLEQCPRHVGWAALSFDPAGRTVTRSHCCLRLTRGQPCLGGSAAIACSTRRGSVGAVPLSQAPLLSEPAKSTLQVQIGNWSGWSDLVIPMCYLAENTIGSHGAALHATL